jgi:eukaryotic-like serine/threonine-protein kinase
MPTTTRQVAIAVDSDIAELARAERLQEAGALAAARGDLASAAQLFERACNFGAAADAFERAGATSRALELWVLAGNTTAAERCLNALDAIRDRDLLVQSALNLAARADHAWAANCYALVEDWPTAAAQFDRASKPEQAAACLERSGDVVGAARMLEVWIRKQPDLPVLRIQLGRLLLKFGKTEAAVRHLQRATPEDRPEALALLAEAFGMLGLDEARRLALTELAALGGVQAMPIEREKTAVAVRIFGRYVLLREVAETPTARLLECEDAVRQQRVALKIFASVAARGGGRDALARFEREVRALSSLDHPNVVGLTDYIAEGPAIAMEWMSGGTLETLLQTSIVTPRRAIEIACALLSALAEAHRLGIIHRDLKPANVLFDAAGTAKLGDFGVSHLGDLSATATAAVVGSRGYMSPEQRMGTPATARSDVYGVGALLLEMLTGLPPADGDAETKRPSAAHRDLDANHDTAVLCMLAHEPSARPDGALAARSLLTALRWPDILQQVAVRELPAANPAPSTTRFQPDTYGSAWDTLLERRVVRVAPEPVATRRAALFACAALPQFQRVYAIAADGGALLLGPPPVLSPALELTASERTWLVSGLTDLHQRGCVHGAVDMAHVGRSASGAPLIAVNLCATAHATLAEDLAALARL